MRPQLGFVAALADEANTLVRHPRIDWRTVPALVEQSGMGGENAAAATQRLLQAGVDGLISWGTAGSLDARCVPGTVVLYDAVRSGRGPEYRCDENWTRRVGAALDGARVLVGAGYCAERAVTGAAEKAALRAFSTCVAVDMESAAVGALAAAAGVPFIVVRVIVDAADFNIPACAAAAIDADGNARFGPVLLGLVKNPLQLYPLLRLARCYALALRQLREIAGVLQPHFAHPLLIDNRV